MFLEKWRRCWLIQIPNEEYVDEQVFLQKKVSFPQGTWESIPESDKLCLEMQKMMSPLHFVQVDDVMEVRNLNTRVVRSEWGGGGGPCKWDRSFLFGGTAQAVQLSGGLFLRRVWLCRLRVTTLGIVVVELGSWPDRSWLWLLVGLMVRSRRGCFIERHERREMAVRRCSLFSCPRAIFEAWLRCLTLKWRVEKTWIRWCQSCRYNKMWILGALGRQGVGECSPCDVYIQAQSN